MLASTSGRPCPTTQRTAGVSRPLVLAGSPAGQTGVSDPSVADVVIQLSDLQDRELSAKTVEDSLLSLFGIIGLSGVIVNDALVMLDFIDERRREGDGRRDAIVAGASRRFRPILLTSLTTFLGVFPLVVEQSIQAQFLIPLAVSLAFGVLLGTVLLMLGVTALAELQMRWTEE